MKRTQIFNLADVTPALVLQTARALAQGALAVIPTDTVYGIATGAFCEQSIREIGRLKNRPVSQAFQFLMSDMQQVRRVAQLGAEASALARAFWPGALTLILPPTPQGRPLLRGFEGLGIRVPAAPFLQQLLKQTQTPLACTSANRHGSPVLTKEQDLVELFEGKVDFIFKGGTLTPLASSVVDLTGQPRLLREGALPKKELEQVMGRLFINERSIV